jgi:hypothetical protein
MSEVVLSGVASEYVLGDLANYLRQHGHRVHEFDFADFKGDAVTALGSLDGSQCTYITSAHTNLTRAVAEVLVPLFATHYPNYLAPLEILGILRPRQSIFIPHDLLTPFGDTNFNEYRYLDLFDHILAPFKVPALQATLGAQTKVHTVGWIKHANIDGKKYTDNTFINNDTIFKKSQPKVAVFISMIEHMRWKYGDQGVYEYLEPLFNSNVQIKLPDWNGIDTIEALCKKDNRCNIFPSKGNSIELIKAADIVVCNSASSIHAEANLMGRPTICLIDDEFISESELRVKLDCLSNIYFHDYRNRIPLSDEFLVNIMKKQRPQPALKFNFEIVNSIIN